MAYIGRGPTNSGEFIILDDISSGFDGSDTSFTLTVGTTEVTPAAANVTIALDGVIQTATSAYSVTGSTINFTEAPASGQEFHGVLAGQSQYISDSSITNQHISGTANISGSKISTDFGSQNIQIIHVTASGDISVDSMSIPVLSTMSSSVATRFDSRETDMTLATASIALNESNMTLATASIAAITASLGQPVNTDSNVTFNNINSTGTITATEIHTTFVSSSITVASGSNNFGDATDDHHSFTGSLSVSSSLSVTGSTTITGTLSVNGSPGEANSKFAVDGNIEMLSGSNRLFIPRASDGALTTSIFSRTGNNLTLSGAGSSAGQIEFIPSSANSSAVAMTIDSSQRVAVGNTSPAVVGGYYAPKFSVEGDDFKGVMSVIEHQNGISGGIVSIGKSRGTSAGAVTILQTDDITGRLLFSSADGVDYRTISAEIRTVVGASPGANDVPGHLLFMTNDGSGNDSKERVRIESSGTLSTISGSAVSYFSNGQSTGSGDATHLIAQDLDEMQQNDSDNAYHRMKALKVTKSGKLRVRFTGKNESGAYYWSWLISKNGGGTGNLADITEVSPTAMTTLTGNALGAFSDGLADGQASGVHSYKDFDVTVTNVEPGDQIELWMRLADGGGGQVTGGGQDLFAKDFKLLSQTPSIVQNPALDFSANSGVSAVVNNATSFILDRYEEGLIDVTMGAGSGTITINSSADTLFYTRIGRVVHIQGRLEVASVSGNSGEFTIIGLPYAAHDPGGDAANVIAGIYFENASSSIANNIIGIIADGSTTMAIRISGSTSAGATLADKVDADTNILISGWYHTQAYES